MYLTYSEYQGYGGNLTEAAFNLYEFEARTKVQHYTFNRLDKGTGFSGQSTSVKEAVKQCMYKLIVMLQELEYTTASSGETTTQDSSATAGISSMSNDGVAVSYNTLSAKDVTDRLDKQMDTTIKSYLGSCKNTLGQKLLYRGIYEDE